MMVRQYLGHRILENPPRVIIIVIVSLFGVIARTAERFLARVAQLDGRMTRISKGMVRLRESSFKKRSEFQEN